MNRLSLRVLVAGDEQLARRRLMRLLSTMSDVTVVGECADSDAVLARLRADDPEVDVLFLDIYMPNMTGAELKALLPDGWPYVVFTTAHEAHALQTFDLDSADYILNPIEPVRVRQALDRARQQFEALLAHPE